MTRDSYDNDGGITDDDGHHATVRAASLCTFVEFFDLNFLRKLRAR